MFSCARLRSRYERKSVVLGRTVGTHARVAGSLQFLQEHERKPAVDGLDLMSLLILPVQQLPR
jgi:hypothetical protein